ncbi:ATP-binding protein [Nocardioides sp. GCM10027113]|uniref:ATP-binding protein n=1 Tax=Nocardioides sp. GCM10027113 TaxID=3273405 RepID=UPI00366B2E6A
MQDNEQQTLSQALEEAQAALGLLSGIDAFVVGLRPGCDEVVSVSAGALACTGMRLEQLVGRPLWRTIVHPADRFAMRQLLAPDSPLGLVIESRLHTRWGTLVHTWSRRDIDLRHDGPWILLSAQAHEPDGPGAYPAPFADASLFQTDRDGRITRVGVDAEQLLGYDAAELLGRPALHLFEPAQVAHRADAAGLEAGPQLLRADPRCFDRRRREQQVDLGDLDRRQGERPRQEPGSCDWSLVHKDGRELVVSLTVRPLAAPGGEPVGYRFSGRDVTEERRTSSLLVRALLREKDAAGRAAQLDKARTEFVAAASHELRTPLASILGYAELISDQAHALPPELRQFVDAIVRNTERLQHLAEDLLTLSPHSGQIPLPDDVVELAEVLAAVAETIEPIAAARGIRLATTTRTASPLLVRGVGSRLEQVLVNLLGNALKFTGSGGEIGCHLDREGLQAVMEVTDTGIGIDAAHLREIFLPFFRAPEATKRAIHGTGLGLSITEQIVNEHGGSIDVASRVGRGSTFTVRFPLVCEADPEAG